ncbi:MAG TPA: hypothetical protein VGB70_00640 [Allosphingosinicella sp.]|jgi:MraZ protein
MGHFFSGSAVSIIDRNKRVTLPPFVRTVLAHRSGGGNLLLGRHESDPCLIGYDRSQVPHLAAELERLRLRDEAAGVDASAHHARLRRIFGLASEVSVDARGKALLPELERRRSGLDGAVLFVGTGATFELWSLEQAARSSSATVAEIARFHFEHSRIPAVA